MAQVKTLKLRVQLNPILNLELPETSTIKDVMSKIGNKENVAWNTLQLMDKSNFPPKVISTNPYETLKQLNIQSQTIISVRKVNPQNFDHLKPKSDRQNNNNNNKNHNNNNNNNMNINNTNKENKNQNNNNLNQNKNNNFGNILNGKLIREKIPNDNACLFNSIQLCFDDEHKINNDRTQDLREMCASIILSDSDSYTKVMLDGKTNEQYSQWIMKRNSWGGEIELSILSHILQIVIITIDIESLKIFKYGESDGYKDCIYLLYSGIHYDSIIMEFVRNNGTKYYKYKFNFSDDYILAQALSLAEDLNRKNQYTNVWKFALMCADCGKGLVGQSEAVAHAQQTGHQNFQEYKKK